MFQSIKYMSYHIDDEYNVYQLRDSCFVNTIISPYKSPSLINIDNRLGNTLTMLSIGHCYETMNRNVSLNLAYYYSWLNDSQSFYIDKKFIHKQFYLLDSVIKNTNYLKKYYHNTCHYLINQHLLPLE